jgi:hypothetical protein
MQRLTEVENMSYLGSLPETHWRRAGIGATDRAEVLLSARSEISIKLTDLPIAVNQGFEPRLGIFNMICEARSSEPEIQNTLI